MMRIETREVEVRRTVSAWRAAGDRIGLVPTMGALHEGHLSLVHRARERAEWVVVSIFVNPTQFGEPEDLDAYPQTPAEDEERLAAAGCDLLFRPTAEAIYPPGHATAVEPAGAALGLEGTFRPGHFRGVATVVTQLFAIVAPDIAVFGQKDAQQLAVVRQVVRDLHLPVEIVSGPTVREPDGLAMSSRNRHLSPEERSSATALWRALTAVAERVTVGERTTQRMRDLVLEILADEPLAEVEYVDVVDAETFRPVDRIDGPVVVPLAARLGSTRLIDNVALDPDGSGARKESP